MHEPSVSVLIPCFNKEAYLEETLESVYAQTFSDWELIVVDDGSTDRSADILHRHEGRLRALFQSNQGASAARQSAVAEARGRYIQYLDADDLLLPGALGARVTALQASDGDVAYGDWQRIRRTPGGSFERAEVIEQRIEDVSADAEVACFTSFWSPPAALLYSRRIVGRIGRWNPSLPVIQDARYLLDAAFAGARFVHVPGVSALYREGGIESLSQRSKAAFIQDVVRNADQVNAIWQARGALQERQLLALIGCYNYAARSAFRQDEALFDYCVSQLEVLGQRGPRWPTLAAALKRTLGRRAALALLGMLGRPAP